MNNETELQKVLRILTEKYDTVPEYDTNKCEEMYDCPSDVHTELCFNINNYFELEGNIK